MVPFAGYAMPVQYPAGLMAEHKHCREAAALFDVSHMGQVRLVGADAAAALERLVPVDVLRDLEREGRIGKLHNTFYSTTGVANIVAVMKKLGWEIAEELQAAGVSGVILTST